MMASIKQLGRSVENERTPEKIAGEAGLEEAKRLAARRRFLRMGAGASASAMLVTVAHKRAFAAGPTIKKGAIISACVSLQGRPDITDIHHKKPLQFSAMGNPKNVVCRPRDSMVNNCVAPQGKGTYIDQFGNKVSYQFYTDKQLKDGCGLLEDTVRNSFDYRLHEKHYCPVVFDSAGDLTYDLNAKWFSVDNKGRVIANACQ